MHVSAKNHSRGRVVKHVHGHCTQETVGYIVYYRICRNVAPMPKSPEKNQASKGFDRFIRLCTVCFHLFDVQYNNNILNSNNNS